MSARIQADFLRLDKALRGGCNLRSSLKADSLPAWEACRDSLADVASFINGGACIFTSASDKSAAVWVQWRKSNTSKQLLSLVRSALDAAAAAEANGREVSAPVRRCLPLIVIGLHGSISVVSYFYSAAAAGVLWPALREWLVEQGGVATIWRALTWDLEGACAVGEGGVRVLTGHVANSRACMLLDSVDTFLSLSLRCPKPPPQPNDALLKGHGGGGMTALQLTLGKLIPAAFPKLQPDARKRAAALAHRIGLLCCSSTLAAENGGQEYLESMHLPALQAWPYLVGAARHHLSLPVQDSVEREGIQVRAPGCCFASLYRYLHRIGAWCMAHGAWHMDHNQPSTPPRPHRRLLWDRCSLSWRPSPKPFVSPTGLGIGHAPSTSSSWRRQRPPGKQRKQQQQQLVGNPDGRPRQSFRMLGAQQPPGPTGPNSSWHSIKIALPTPEVCSKATVYGSPLPVYRRVKRVTFLSVYRVCLKCLFLTHTIPTQSA